MHTQQAVFLNNLEIIGRLAYPFHPPDALKDHGKIRLQLPVVFSSAICLTLAPSSR